MFLIYIHYSVEKVGFLWISYILKYNLTLITLVLTNKLKSEYINYIAEARSKSDFNCN